MSHLIRYYAIKLKPSLSSGAGFKTVNNNSSTSPWWFVKNELLRSSRNVGHVRLFSERQQSIKSQCQQLWIVKEMVFDKLVIFTRILHQQSHIYLSLRLRRVTQLFHLYYRIYPQHEFKSTFIDHYLKLFLDRCSKSRFLTNLFKGTKLAMMSSVLAFAWEDTGITDQEFAKLIDEFNFFEETKEKINCDSSSQSDDSSKNGSYSIVNCLGNGMSGNDQWEVVINRPNFHVWRKSVGNASLYEYKVFGSFFDISAYSFYSVQRDLEFRKEWDRLVLKLDVIDSEPRIEFEPSGYEDSGNELVHWIMKYPYPMRSREYLFLRRTRIDYENKLLMILSRSVPVPQIDESGEFVRVHDYMSQMIIKPHDDDFFKCGFDFMLTYFDDPRASFPSPAYNWMASRGVPDFVEKLHRAAKKLSDTKLKDLDLKMPNFSKDSSCNEDEDDDEESDNNEFVAPFSYEEFKQKFLKKFDEKIVYLERMIKNHKKETQSEDESCSDSNKEKHKDHTPSFESLSILW